MVELVLTILGGGCFGFDLVVCGGFVFRFTAVMVLVVLVVCGWVALVILWFCVALWVLYFDDFDVCSFGLGL